jgi:hypothetical protein
MLYYIGKVGKKMIRVYKIMKRKGYELLKEYKTMKGALDYVENVKNYDSILVGVKNNKQVVIYQTQQERKNFWEKLLDLLHIA